MRSLELRIPPPLVALLTALAMWAVARVSIRIVVDAGVRGLLAAGLLLLGLGISIAGVVAFRRARTTVNPLRPEATTALVVSGIYRRTRNPMYLGMAIALVAWAVQLAAPWAMLGPVAFVAWITRFQIVPEERALANRFGSGFDDYRRKVSRWL